MLTVMNRIRLSENEFAFDGQEHAVQIRFNGIVRTVQPGDTVYLRDRADYTIYLVEDDHYRGDVYRIAVNQTLPPEFTEGRVVLDWQAEIEAERHKHIQRIDVEAEQVRAQFITLGAGQAMTYLRKEQEARMVIADPEGIDPAAVPHIRRQAERKGVTLLDEAGLVLTVAAPWVEISAMIDDLRLAAKNSVMSAQDLADVDAASIVNWSAVNDLVATL